MHGLVRDRLLQLKQMPFDELSSLPACQDESRDDDVSLVLWVDCNNGSEVKVVMQVCKVLCCGIGFQLLAQGGFVMRKDGAVRDLDERELRSFL